MLGLGNSMTGGAALEDVFTPESISNIAVWLSWNTNITADQDASPGNAYDPVHSTTAGNMVNGDRINFWGGAGSTSVNATQDISGDKPRWSTTTGELGGILSANNNKHMDLSSTITFAANTDFTIVIRFRANDFGGARTFLGHSTDEFIRLMDENTIRVKTDGSSNDVDSGTDLVADKDTTLIIVRSDGSTGNINMYVRGKDSSYFDTATGVAWGSEFQDTEEIEVSNIMASADNTSEFDGTFKDVIIYNGTAVTSAQREQIFDYLEAQED
tara:strand:+ start:712 stop:1524 length:813 start_codon:yes stop_codon:yes gene_type:complete